MFPLLALIPGVKKNTVCLQSVNLILVVFVCVKCVGQCGQRQIDCGNVIADVVSVVEKVAMQNGEMSRSSHRSAHNKTGL